MNGFILFFCFSEVEPDIYIDSGVYIYIYGDSVPSRRLSNRHAEVKETPLMKADTTHYAVLARNKVLR